MGSVKKSLYIGIEQFPNQNRKKLGEVQQHIDVTIGLEIIDSIL
jgi:hypothetical protein